MNSPEPIWKRRANNAGQFLATLMLFCPLSLSAQTALLVQVKGKAERTVQNQWIEAQRADTLRLGDRLRTAKQAQAIARFEDGSILRVGEKTELELVAPKEKQAREVRLSKGILTYDVKARPDAPFRFRSPTAAAAIKGTTGSFETDGRATNFIVESSETQDDVAEFETARGEKRTLDVGEVATLNRAGKLALRQIFEEERRAIQNEVNDMRRVVEEELRKIKEEIEQTKRELQDRLQNERDSLKRSLDELRQEQRNEAEDAQKELERIKEELRKEREEMRKLFDR